MAIRTFLAFILVVLLGYGGVKGYPFLSGPDLHIDTPAAYETAERGIVVVSGRARYTETLTMNGRAILIDEHERFEETFTLPSGGAILSLTATDRFGRAVTQERTVFIP